MRAGILTAPPRRLRIPGAAAMLALLVAGFTLANPAFASAPNLINIMMQSSVLVLLALPMTLVIMTEGLDLSVGALVSLSSLALATVALETGSVWLALFAALVVGLAVGAANGVLVAALDLPPFVATLGVMGVVQGLCLVISGGQSIVNMPDALLAVYQGSVFGIPAPLALVTAAYALLHFLLYHTAFGAYVFGLGGNREALVLAGVPQRLVLCAVYALNGAMAGLAGLLLTARLSAGHPTAGNGMEFDAIAAVAVGGTAFEKGNGWLPGTLIGVAAIGVLRNGLNLLAVPSALQVTCIGLLVILAFLIETLRGERP